MIEQVLIGTASPSPLMHLIALVSSVRSAELCIERISQASSFLVTVDFPPIVSSLSPQT